MGSFGRAKKIATFLDEDTPEVYIESARGFLTITGHYSGIRVSIIAIGMVTFTLLEYYYRYLC